MTTAASAARVWQLSVVIAAAASRGGVDGNGVVSTAVDIDGRASCCFDAVDDVIVTDNADDNGDRADVLMSNE